MTNSKLDPSKYSLQGFMGKDTRSLPAIIASDRKSFKALKVPARDLIDALKKAAAKARKAFGAEVEVRKGLRGIDEGARGIVPCPLCGKSFEKGESVLIREEDGKKLIITPLSLHLADKHAFFQGKGAYYRIEPSAAVEFLGISNKKPARKKT